MSKSSNKALAMLSILLLSSMLVSPFTVTPSRAVDYTKVGVEVGDWAYYSGSSNTPSFPEEFYINFTVTDIDRSNVTYTMAMYFTNGTLFQVQTLWGNISSGQGSVGPPIYTFLAVPGLAKDDPVFIGSPMKINDTSTMTAASKARVYALSTTSEPWSQDLRWDQATGICLRSYVDAGGQYLGWILTSTSLWPSPSYEVGVEVGDWAYYSTDMSAQGWTEVTAFNVTITQVVRYNVTLSAAYYFGNGTAAATMTYWGNLTSGEHGPASYPAPAWFVLTAANLVENDSVFSNSPIWINETTTMKLFYVQRAVNHLMAPDPLGTGEVEVDLYWDRVTGINVKGNETFVSGPDAGASINWTLASTSLWAPPIPTIDTPGDITYEHGATGNSITWQPTSELPCNSTITRNGTIIHCTSWEGGNKTVNVDGLEVGTYVYTCIVNDTLGREASDSVTVTVTASQAGQPFPVEVLLLVGGGIAAVAVVAGIIVLRRRSS